MESGGAKREKGYDWLEEERRGKKERGAERIEAGRKKMRGGRGSDCKWGGTGRGETGMYREREQAEGRRLTAPLLGEGLLMTAYSFMISIPDSRQVCLLHHGSCIITFWPCHCSAS